MVDKFQTFYIKSSNDISATVDLFAMNTSQSKIDIQYIDETLRQLNAIENYL
jgi:hypothetical protein